ncbi:GOLPH3/VPS74 family protein [Streptomyces albidus (ex Kaewkla and Franco 2022)]|uniref:GOLPH3/VPS74 family protein n=1 Tax=Streptomyces albidus (ex Kaewkla and Franco 2022) TaxID=722709 RepID=UPI0015EECF33|nr:GPP34 family phosphoprotein [Streptomyces albidus (ex Kaewkla and Franco 2022)]
MGDMDRTDKNQGLTLPAELYLLACDIEKEKLGRREVLGNVLRAAVLVELTDRGCLIDEDGKAHTVGDRRTGDPVLDDSLRAIAEDRRPRKWKALVQLHRKQVFQGVEQQLVRERIIGIEHRTWRYDKIVVKDTGLAKRLRAEAVETLTSGRPVEDFSTRQAALTALAALGELPSVASGKERREHKARIKALTERAGQAGPALKKALNEMDIATMVVITGAATAAGN